MDASGEKGQSDLGYGQKIFMQIVVYFEQKIWLNIKYNQAGKFQYALRNISIFNI